MAAHPLPALPTEPNDDEGIELWDGIDRQIDRSTDESELRGILRRSDGDLALFDDTSEISIKTFFHLGDHHENLKTLQHKVTLFNDSEVLPPPRDAYDACGSNDPSSAHLQQSKHDSLEATAVFKHDDPGIFCAKGEGGSPAKPYSRVSYEAVCDYIPSATPISQHDRSQFEADNSILDDAIKDEDFDKPFRTPLVRFADAHTILCTPSPPTPPPHRNHPAVSSLSLPFTRRDAFEPHRLQPYGPRIPPWGSTDNLDRERRLRTDLRVLEDTLDERFDEDCRRRAIERRCTEEEVRSGRRRTEGEELREAVLGVYPEMELERGEGGRGCWGCGVM